MKAIDDFRDPNYSFLMNSHPSDVELDGQYYRTLEHAFQAAKTDDHDDRVKIKFAPSARKAKQIGRKIPIRPNWDNERVDVMRDLLKKKFEDEDLRCKLLATKDAQLISGGDKFWGMVQGQGENHLGKLLMDLRASIIQENSTTLDRACRDYLEACGWARDAGGDGMFGECWTPPWDEDCQYSLMDAVSEQRKLAMDSADSDDDDEDDIDDEPSIDHMPL
ncbi:NADAR family protein [Candidatus Bathyarchaeota archaeon]|nr:NADAR family protein [Candidatus Bathyarchaeota archaeon]